MQRGACTAVDKARLIGARGSGRPCSAVYSAPGGRNASLPLEYNPLAASGCPTCVFLARSPQKDRLSLSQRRAEPGEPKPLRRKTHARDRPRSAFAEAEKFGDRRKREEKERWERLSYGNTLTGASDSATSPPPPNPPFYSGGTWPEHGGAEGGPEAAGDFEDAACIAGGSVGWTTTPALGLRNVGRVEGLHAIA
ncbi:hypothetical protein MTO96_005061 [Rhipicephalus appendiculatus]